MNFNLSHSWNRTQPPFYIQAPKQNQKRLLLIEPFLFEIQEWVKQGWEVEVLTVSFDLNKELLNGPFKAHFIQIYDLNSFVLGEFDLIYASHIISLVSDIPKTLEYWIQQLSPQGQLIIQAKNANYYQGLIDKTTREYYPWPYHLPRGQELNLKQWQEIFGSQTVETEQEMDALYEDPRALQWQAINGTDCTIHLPQNAEERKSYFIKLFRFKFKSGTTFTQTKVENQSVVAPLKSLSQNIDDALSQGLIIETKTYLKQYESQNGQDAKWFNWSGMIYFYENQFLESYLAFIDAIEKDFTQLDYWLNLKDAAQKIDRMPDFQSILNYFIQREGHIAPLNHVELNM